MVALVILCLVIVFASAIRKFLGEWFQMVAVSTPIALLWYWSGIKREVLTSWTGAFILAGLAMIVMKWPQIEAAVKRMQGTAEQVRAGYAARQADKLNIADLPDLSPQARLRRQLERGLITDEEYMEKSQELQRPKTFSSNR